MMKNVLVVDEQGKMYEATYPRRARGLVKSRRARFVGENQICLISPLGHEKESIMENNQVVTPQIPSQVSPRVTPQQLLERIDFVTKETVYIKDAFMTIEKIPHSGEAAQDAAAKCEAVATIVREREETNRRVIDLLEKMYDHLI